MKLVPFPFSAACREALRCLVRRRTAGICARFRRVGAYDCLPFSARVILGVLRTRGARAAEAYERRCCRIDLTAVRSGVFESGCPSGTTRFACVWGRMFRCRRRTASRCGSQPRRAVARRYPRMLAPRPRMLRPVQFRELQNTPCRVSPIGQNGRCVAVVGSILRHNSCFRA